MSKDSFKDFVANRYGCLGELSSMFVNHNLTIVFLGFFANQVDIHTNKLAVEVHAYYTMLGSPFAGTFHKKLQSLSRDV